MTFLNVQRLLSVAALCAVSVWSGSVGASSPAHHATSEVATEAHGGEHEAEFKAGEFIVHHIADAHEIHFFGDVHLPLPVILHVEERGFEVFSSDAFHGHGHGDREFTSEKTGTCERACRAWAVPQAAKASRASRAKSCLRRILVRFTSRR